MFPRQDIEKAIEVVSDLQVPKPVWFIFKATDFPSRPLASPARMQLQVTVPAFPTMVFLCEGSSCSPYLLTTVLMTYVLCFLCLHMFGFSHVLLKRLPYLRQIIRAGATVILWSQGPGARAQGLRKPWLRVCVGPHLPGHPIGRGPSWPSDSPHPHGLSVLVDCWVYTSKERRLLVPQKPYKER